MLSKNGDEWRRSITVRLSRCGLWIGLAAAGMSTEGPAAQPRPPQAAGLAPLAAARAMTLPPGFQVRLLAAEPDVRQPIAMAFDDRGRLWVAEAYSYPVRVPDEEARDRILIFEDTDGDETLETRKVFLEGLNLVSGLEVGFGGVWVGCAPDLLFIPDRNGDDVPDGSPEVILDGWGFQDTHETLNAFTWGPDGWLYGCHGVFTHSAVGPPGTPAAERVKINAGIWRLHPLDRRFEVFSEGTSNPWGVDFNDVGDTFQTACVIPHLYHVIQGGRYQRQAGQHFNPWTFDDIKTIARHRHWVGGQWTAADRDQSDAVGGGHAHCGAMVYLGSAWPAEYRGRLFMNNIHGARLNVDRLTPFGSGYVGEGDPDFLFANDTWSQFIALQYGPDGQVVLIDWYDRNQCHHRETETHDRENGRIFKVIYRSDEPASTGTVPRDLAACSDADLIDLLGHANDWFARHARRLLQERAASGSLASDTAGRLAARLDETTRPEARLRLVWAMHAVGCLDETALLHLTEDPHPHVRGWAIQLACEPLRPDAAMELPSALAARFVTLAADDPSPVVRRFLASAVDRLPLRDRWAILTGLIGHAEDAEDHNLPLLCWYATEPLVSLDPRRALDLAAASRLPTVSRYVVRRAAVEAAGLEAVLSAVAAAASAERRWMLAEVKTALAQRGAIPTPSAWPLTAATLRADPDPTVVAIAVDVGAWLGDIESLTRLRQRLADRAASTASRLDALAALEAVRDPSLPELLHATLEEPALRRAALAALPAVPDDRTPEAILSTYASLPTADREAAIAALTSRPAWTLALLDAMESGRLPRSDLSAFAVARLSESKDQRVTARLNEVWGTIRPPAGDHPARRDHWKRIARGSHPFVPDLGHGRMVFEKTCAGCHRLHGEGAAIGPELTGSNRRDLDYLLDNLLDPSAIVGRDYQVTQIITSQGRSIAGIVVAESPTAVTLQTPTERVVVPLADVESRQLSPLSLMPANQLDLLDEGSARDLLAYLRHPTQVAKPDPASSTPQPAAGTAP